MIRLMTANTSNQKARDAIINKKRRKRKKKDSSDSSLSDSDSSDKSDNKIKRLNNKKSCWKNYPIKLCAKLTPKLLMTAYKSKIIHFKLNEDPLQRRIYFPTFIESLEMIFSPYKENCELLL